MAPGGVEPPRADSKSAALSAELRGRGPQFALEPVVRIRREPDAEHRQGERDCEVQPPDPDETRTHRLRRTGPHLVLQPRPEDVVVQIGTGEEVDEQAVGQGPGRHREGARGVPRQERIAAGAGEPDGAGGGAVGRPDLAPLRVPDPPLVLEQDQVGEEVVSDDR